MECQVVQLDRSVENKVGEKRGEMLKSQGKPDNGGPCAPWQRRRIFTLDAWYMLGITVCWTYSTIGPWQTLGNFQWKDEDVIRLCFKKV